MGQGCSCGAGRPRKDRPVSPVEPRPPPLENPFYDTQWFPDQSNLLPINEISNNALLRNGLAVPKVANADSQALVDSQAVNGGRVPQKTGDTLPLSSGEHPKRHKSGDKVRFGSGSGIGEPDGEVHGQQPREESLGLDPDFLAQLVAADPGPRAGPAHHHTGNNDHDILAVHHTKPDDVVHVDTKVAGSHNLHADVATPPIRTLPSRLHDLNDDVRIASNLGAPVPLHNLHADAKTLPPRLSSPAHDLLRDIRTAPVRTTSSPSHGIHTDPVIGAVIGSSKPHLLRLDHKDDGGKGNELMRSASQDGASDATEDRPERYRAKKSKTQSRRSNMRSSEMSSDGAMDANMANSMAMQQQAAINHSTFTAAAAGAHQMHTAAAAQAAHQGAVGSPFPSAGQRGADFWIRRNRAKKAEKRDKKIADKLNAKGKLGGLFKSGK